LLFVCAKNGPLDIRLILPPSGGMTKRKRKITKAMLLKAVYGKARYRPRHQTPPWAAIGIARATWYRQGKPTKKRHRVTQPQAAAQLKTSIRSLQRTNRIKRLAPELMPLLADGRLTLRKAEAHAVAKKQKPHRSLGAVLKSNLAFIAWHLSAPRRSTQVR
jgi:hypothetical protein